jgi:hypothetical protein
MSLDRIIHWVQRKPQDPSEIANFLTRYMGAAEAKFEFSPGEDINCVWTVSLPGVGTDPFSHLRRAGDEGPFQKDRWFEVHLSDDNMDVLTRTQDPFVNAIAEGFADLVCRWYGGKRDPDHKDHEIAELHAQIERWREVAQFATDCHAKSVEAIALMTKEIACPTKPT